MIKLLIEKNAYIYEKNISGKAPIDIASEMVNNANSIIQIF